GGTLTSVGVYVYESAGSGEAGDLDPQIRQTLQAAKSELKIGGEPVVFSLPSHSTFNRLIKLPPMEESKLPEMVKYEAQQQIPFPIDEVIWDYQYVEREYAHGEEKEVILFAIKKDIVEGFLANIAGLNFNVEAIQFGPVALFNFLVRESEGSGPIIALDMGGDNTDLIVVDGTKFWVRNLPITGNTITKELARGFNIPFEEAEKLKLKAGQSQQAQKIFNVLQPVLRDLVNEMNRSMGYYKSISKTSKFERVLLLGNAAKTLNFTRFLGQSLQLPVTPVDKLTSIGVGGSVDAAELRENIGTLATAVGLALQGSGEAVNSINLLPQQEQSKKLVSRKKPWVIAATAALYVLVGLMWHWNTAELEKLKTSVNRAKDVKKDVEAATAAFETAKKLADVQSQIEPLAGLALERDLALRIMDEINPNIPNNGDKTLDKKDRLWVVNWRFEEKSADPPPATGGSTPPANLYPSKKVLTTSIEVVIPKPRNDPDGRAHIIRQLLNYNEGARQPAAPGKPCVLKNEHWDLEPTQWGVQLDHAPNAGEVMPVPKGFPQEKLPQDADKLEKNYWRYRVTLDIPVGGESRKPAAAKK
ncbi:MAG TPA: type IV pilus assembly protein PilM, partial [Planctomycetota bacterium]|nr:type IV pilus assembly protein PilM [Planctomycetota bacterium]